MVSKFINGTSIKGALNYNEKKVREGKAELICAEGYGLEKEQLSFSNKLARLQNLAVLRPNVVYNCVHVSLNFDPEEVLINPRLIAIANAYLEKTGFKDQPFLVYKHLDAAHPHIHILTTNITADGGFINLHNIGRTKSETARKEIEQVFGLVRAEGREQKQEEGIKPIAEKVIYGKSETKATVSNVVRNVVKDYKYTSLGELNAVLKKYNVTAFRGEEGSAMYAKRGLIYSVLDNEGNKIGVPIKASSIYTRPTLLTLEKQFELNKEKRKPQRQRLKNIIDKTLDAGNVPTKEAFAHALNQNNIDVVFRENENLVYGITFIDGATKAVFNGSALGKAYSAASLMRRIGKEGVYNQNEQKENRTAVEQALKNADFSKGIAQMVAQLYAQGFCLKATDHDESDAHYLIGMAHTREDNYMPVSKKLAAYFQVNGFSKSVSDKITDYANSLSQNTGGHLTAPVSQLGKVISELLASEQAVSQASQPIPSRKKKRKLNW